MGIHLVLGDVLKRILQEKDILSMIFGYGCLIQLPGQPEMLNTSGDFPQLFFILIFSRKPM